MNAVLTPWPNLDRAIWTVATLALAYILGFVVNRIVMQRLRRLAAHTTGEWDDAVIAELRKRIPFWALLGGVLISVGYWPQLTHQWATAISRTAQALLVLSVTSAVAAIAVRMLTVAGPRAQHGLKVSGLTKNIVRMVVFTIGLLVVLRGFEIEITPMLAALGVGGLAIALALQEPLSNLFAGIFVTVGGQMRIGDYVKLEGGPEGYITDFKWHATQLQSMPGNLVIVPNAKLAQAIVTNFTRPTPDVGIGVEVTVAPEADLARVEQIAIDAAVRAMSDVPGGMPDVEPSVRFTAFSNLGVTCAVGVRCKTYADHQLVRHELIKRLQRALIDAEIRLPTVETIQPQRPRTS